MDANEVTQIRNITYLARQPGIDAEMEILPTWINTQIKGGVARTDAPTKTTDVHY